MVGSEFVAKQAPDGYTLLLISGAYPVYPAMLKNMPFDPLKDIAMLSMLTSYPFVISVVPQSRFKTLADLVAHAKEDVAAHRDEPAGHIAIAMPPTLARFHTLPLIRAFRKELPKARLAVIEGFSMHITEWLASGRADLGLVYNPEPLPSLEIQPLRDEFST